MISLAAYNWSTLNLLLSWLHAHQISNCV